jgi:hypothetical protein
MADAPAVHIGENSPEFVAFRLMGLILSGEQSAEPRRTRKEILDLYAQCLLAVRRPAHHLGKDQGDLRHL